MLCRLRINDMKGILASIPPEPSKKEKKVVYKEEWLVAGHTTPNRKKRFLRNSTRMTYRLDKAARWKTSELDEVWVAVHERMRHVSELPGDLFIKASNLVGDLQPMKVTVTVETLG